MRYEIMKSGFYELESPPIARTAIKCLPATPSSPETSNYGVPEQRMRHSRRSSERPLD